VTPRYVQLIIPTSDLQGVRTALEKAICTRGANQLTEEQIDASEALLRQVSRHIAHDVYLREMVSNYE
jgi:DNA-binding GntR family transcriptional regulator